MKATLEFDLTDPKERLSHIQCIKARDMVDALDDILNHPDLKNQEKVILDVFIANDINIDKLTER